MHDSLDYIRTCDSRTIGDVPYGVSDFMSEYGSPSCVLYHQGQFSFRYNCISRFKGFIEELSYLVNRPRSNIYQIENPRQRWLMGYQLLTPLFKSYEQDTQLGCFSGCR